ncbi:hypothetical protein VTN77DRAFT_8619 [Rasamsonia byssochlamydoides]|uniref:uncharacterized protein n=1 Tax=Rasamsonia byssochlamydoides TaxID=89139 RepID=UPI0037422F80
MQFALLFPLRLGSLGHGPAWTVEKASIRAAGLLTKAGGANNHGQEAKHAFRGDIAFVNRIKTTEYIINLNPYAIDRARVDVMSSLQSSRPQPGTEPRAGLIRFHDFAPLFPTQCPLIAGLCIFTHSKDGIRGQAATYISDCDQPRAGPGAARSLFGRFSPSESTAFSTGVLAAASPWTTSPQPMLQLHSSTQNRRLRVPSQLTTALTPFSFPPSLISIIILFSPASSVPVNPAAAISRLVQIG